jgi:RNA polymerase sigma-70 factor (family 1)
MEKIDLTQVIKAVQSGDGLAFETLYNEYSRPTYFLALKLMKNPQDAEEIVQDVFVKAYQKLGDLKEPGTFPSWLNRITVNLCTDVLRRNNVLMVAGGEDITEIEFIEETDRSIIPDKSLDNAETARMIIEIIDKLPLPQRVCIYFYYYEHMSIKEIAEQLAVSEKTVSSRLVLAREKIRKELEQLEEDEGLKLYTIIPFILIPAFKIAMENTEVPVQIYSRISSTLNISASAATASLTAEAVVVTAEVTTATATTTATTAATSAVSVKAVAAVIAGIVVVGGIIAAVVLGNPGGDAEPVLADETRQTRQTEEVDMLVITDAPNVVTEYEPEVITTSPPDEQQENNSLAVDGIVLLSRQGITDEMLIEMLADGRIPQDVTSLHLWNNEITDISPLSELVNLTYLGIANNQITDITPLGALINLTELDLSRNEISDITSLSNLVNIEWLDLTSNKIIDLTPLSGLKSLNSLRAEYNLIADWSPVAHVDNVRGRR